MVCVSTRVMKFYVSLNEPKPQIVHVFTTGLNIIPASCSMANCWVINNKMSSQTIKRDEMRYKNNWIQTQDVVYIHHIYYHKISVMITSMIIMIVWLDLLKIYCIWTEHMNKLLNKCLFCKQGITLSPDNFHTTVFWQHDLLCTLTCFKLRSKSDRKQHFFVT